MVNVLSVITADIANVNMNRQLLHPINPLLVNKGDKYLVIAPVSTNNTVLKQGDMVFCTGNVLFNRAVALIEITVSADHELDDFYKGTGIAYVPYQYLAKEVN